MSLKFDPSRGRALPRTRSESGEGASTAATGRIPAAQRWRPWLGWTVVTGGALFTATYTVISCSGGADFGPGSSPGNGTGNGTGTTVSTPCAEGDTRACQFEVGRTADTVECFRGTQQCQGNAWGPCGEGMLTRESRMPAMVAGGIHALSKSPSAACPDGGAYQDLCDPNCQWFVENFDASIPPTGSGADAGSDAGADAGPDSGIDAGGSSSGTSQPIDGIACKYAVYSAGALNVGGCTINTAGNIASAGSMTLGMGTVNGNAETCGNFTDNNTINVKGTVMALGTMTVGNQWSAGDGGTAMELAGYQSISATGCASTPPANAGQVWHGNYNNDIGTGSPWATAGNVVAPYPLARWTGSAWSYSLNWGSYHYVDASAPSIQSTLQSQDSLFSACQATCDGGSSPIAIPTQSDDGGCSTSHYNWPDGGNAGTTAWGGTFNNPINYVPGHYGNVTTNSGAKITLLQPGTYYFDSLTLQDAVVFTGVTATSQPYEVYICSSTCGLTTTGSTNVQFQSPAWAWNQVDFTKIRWYISGNNCSTWNGVGSFAGVITAPKTSIGWNSTLNLNGQIHSMGISGNGVLQQSYPVDGGSDPCNPSGWVSSWDSGAPDAGTDAGAVDAGVSCGSAKTAVLFDELYVSACPSGKGPLWTFLTWNSTIPTGSGASIAFNAGVGEVADASTISLSTIGTAALLSDGGAGTQTCPLTGAANSCPVSLGQYQGNVLRLQAQASYTCLSAPLGVTSWKVYYTCLDNL